jgi:hypothetical protein
MKVFSDIFYFIKNFPYRFKRSTKWFFRTFYCEEWDNHHLLEVIKWKIEDMLKLWENPNNIMCVDSERLAIIKDLSRVKGLLDNLIKDDYILCPEMEAHEKKWGSLKLITLPTDREDFSRVEIVNPKAKTDKQKKQCKKEFLVLSKLMDTRKEKDNKELWSLISKKHMHWWD